MALVRMSAMTHAINTDQRRIPLQPVSTGSSTYSVTLPSDRGVVVPGRYMLFALDAAGVPSLGRTVLVG